MPFNYEICRTKNMKYALPISERVQAKIIMFETVLYGFLTKIKNTQPSYN